MNVIPVSPIALDPSPPVHWQQWNDRVARHIYFVAVLKLKTHVKYTVTRCVSSWVVTFGVVSISHKVYQVILCYLDIGRHIDKSPFLLRSQEIICRSRENTAQAIFCLRIAEWKRKQLSFRISHPSHKHLKQIEMIWQHCNESFHGIDVGIMGCLLNIWIPLTIVCWITSVS